MLAALVAFVAILGAPNGERSSNPIVCKGTICNPFDDALIAAVQSGPQMDALVDELERMLA